MYLNDIPNEWQRTSQLSWNVALNCSYIHVMRFANSHVYFIQEIVCCTKKVHYLFLSHNIKHANVLSSCQKISKEIPLSKVWFCYTSETYQLLYKHATKTYNEGFGQFCFSIVSQLMTDAIALKPTHPCFCNICGVKINSRDIVSANVGLRVFVVTVPLFEHMYMCVSKRVWHSLAYDYSIMQSGLEQKTS